MPVSGMAASASGSGGQTVGPTLKESAIEITNHEFDQTA